MTDYSAGAREFAGQAVRFCFLANAGAIVALLAFLGQTWGAPSGVATVNLDPDTVRWAIVLFVLGLVVSVVAALGASVCDLAWVRRVFSALIVVSLSLFLFGALKSAGMLVDAALGGHFPDRHFPEGHFPDSHFPGGP